MLDTTTLFTRGFRADPDEVADATVPAKASNLKAGTILVAPARRPSPCLMRVAGAKDAESWTAFFGTLTGSPEVVVADLDGAIGRAVRETWPGAIVVPSRHHLAAQIRERLLVDGIPERVRLDQPAPTLRPLPWTGERGRRFGPHPLHEGTLGALRGPASWAAYCYRLEAAARSQAGRKRARRTHDAAELAKVIALTPRAAGDGLG